MVDREGLLLKFRRSRRGLGCVFIACSVTLIGAATGADEAQLAPGSATPGKAAPNQSELGTSPASETPDASQAWPQPLGSAGDSFWGHESGLSPEQLLALVGRIAIYPDDLLALVLTASTQPLEIVEAQRFLETRKADPMAKVPKTWDPSVIALLNYPDVIELMDSDLTWMEQLGTSVIGQRAAVLDAIQTFRKQAYRAGNLRSNDMMTVTPDGAPQNETFSISPANPQTIYVPTYDPAAVVAQAPTEDWSAYDWSQPYPYYADSNAVFFPDLWYGGFIGFAFNWHTHQIFCGDRHWDRDRDHDHGDARRNDDGRSRLTSGASVSGPPIWTPSRAVVQRRPTSVISRDLTEMRPAASAWPGDPPRPAAVEPMPQIVRGLSGAGGRSPVEVTRGRSIIPNGTSVPSGVAGPHLAGVAAPFRATRSSTVVEPYSSRMGIGVQQNGLGSAGSGHR